MITSPSTNVPLEPQPDVCETPSQPQFTPFEPAANLPSRPGTLLFDSEIGGVGYSRPVGPKDKGERALLSEEVRRAKSRKEKSRRKVKRSMAVDDKRKVAPPKSSDAVGLPTNTPNIPPTTNAVEELDFL